MYKIIKNRDSLSEWESIVPEEAKVLLVNTIIRNHLRMLVDCLDSCYGAERDLEKDLGGYIVILYGENSSKEIKKIINYHHLIEDEYECEDAFFEPECKQKVTFRLYLCSSDYAVQFVIIENVKEN